MKSRAKMNPNKRKLILPSEWRSDCPSCKRPTKMSPYLGEWYCSRCRKGWAGS